MHRLYFALAESLAGRANRAAGIATSMLGAGRERCDMEMRALRADAGEDLDLVLSGVLAGRYDRLPAGDFLRLCSALREATDAALGAAWLLRGKTLRVWGLFDRVRSLAALTARVQHIVELLETATAAEAASEVESLRGAVRRLPPPEEQLREEDVREDCPLLPEFLLILRLDAWQRALDKAWLSAVALFQAKP